MSWHYSYVLMLITTGLLLVPVSGGVLLLGEGLEPFGAARDVLRRVRAAGSWVLLLLALVQGAGWLLRLPAVGYRTILDWGWVAAVVAAGLLLLPASVAVVAVRDRPGRARQAISWVVRLLCLIQAPYWLFLGLWAAIDFMSRLVQAIA